MALIYISRVTNKIEHHFTCLFTIRVSSSLRIMLCSEVHQCSQSSSFRWKSLPHWLVTFPWLYVSTTVFFYRLESALKLPILNHWSVNSLPIPCGFNHKFYTTFYYMVVRVWLQYFLCSRVHKPFSYLYFMT